MAGPNPIYTSDNTTHAFQLLWSVAVFWKKPGAGDTWLSELKVQCESAGARILEHRSVGATCSLFLASTRPEMSASDIVRGIKGRLQALVRTGRPQALRRNYDVHSIGSTTRTKTEDYVAKQLAHHELDVKQIQAAQLDDLQWVNPEVDLGKYRFSSHGRYCCTLHLGLRFRRECVALSSEELEKVRTIVRRSADHHGLLLSRIGLLEDHLHLVVGISVNDEPNAIALSFMNNIAWSLGLRPVLWHSYYLGTIGEYDLGAIKRG